jgi:hypothetical protein
MPSDFEPNLSVLQGPQRRIWAELSDVPARFILCGGTAVALHLAHRTSVDFDFVAESEFDPDTLYETVPLLRGSTTLQKSANTLSCLVDRGGPVQLSFFGTPTIRFVKSPHQASDTQLNVASLVDLAGMKAAVVQKRAEAKDYLDLDAIVRLGSVDLATALAAGRAIYGSSFNPAITLKSLCYFGDGNLNTLPQEVRDRLARAVKSVDLDQLPTLEPRQS